MSGWPSRRTSTPEDEASRAGATSEELRQPQREDDAEGTVNADLMGTGGLDDVAVDG